VEHPVDKHRITDSDGRNATFRTLATFVSQSKNVFNLDRSCLMEAMDDSTADFQSTTCSSRCYPERVLSERYSLMTASWAAKATLISSRTCFMRSSINNFISSITQNFF
jgi:hypothetical protein